MTTPVEFLRPLEDAPLEDAPRLVFADWCDENGQPERGAFIRYQIELARIEREEDAWHRPYSVNGEVITPEPWGTLRRRERELLNTYGPVWATESALPPPVDTGITPGWFRRGFIERVELPAAEFLRHGRELALAAPVLGVRLSGKAPLYTFSEEAGGHPWAGYGGPCWAWWAPGHGTEGSSLPAELWDRLLCRHKAFAVPRDRVTVDEFATEGDAFVALSRACVDHIRALAGLPAVDWRAVDTSPVETR